ncbi:MAG: glycosyltransferase family 2 protein [Rhodothermales bacterium]|nr:glycosyltransferase family 2 protein [Rhodothermales bacterium]
MLCSVCIATYKRPEWLYQLLRSLAAQQLPAGVELEVIVVDNDPDRSARGVAESQQPISVRYSVQPIKNISLTRNAAVQDARGDYLLFIDDDEVADPVWITTLLETRERFDADGVFGRVVPRFHPNAPAWLQRHAFYHKPCQPTGMPARGMRTANCLIRADLLRGLDGPFDEGFGLTGGEDTHLFERLRKKGARFVDCREAVVTEEVPLERATPAWVRARARRTGTLFSRRRVVLAGGGLPVRIRYGILAGSQFLVAVVLSAGCFWSRFWRLHWMAKALFNLGRIEGLAGRMRVGY